MRLNRYLAAAGFGSRRSCESLVREGRVSINGRPCTQLGTVVSEQDDVAVDGKAARPQALIHVLLHKPAGYLCTRSDRHGGRTVFELLPKDWPRLFHVGRLDKDSEGLLILTNDGELGMRLTHPRHGVPKEYEVSVDRPVAPRDLERMQRGIRLAEGVARAERVKRVGAREVRMVLHQGMNRQIRRMFARVGYRVIALRRTRVGPLKIGELKPGRWRRLTQGEIDRLKGA